MIEWKKFVLGLFAMTTLIIFTIVFAAIEARIPQRSVIFKGSFMPQPEKLNKEVKNMYIDKGKIPGVTVRSFTDGYWCHWDVLVETITGEMYIISPNGSHSVMIYELTSKNTLRYKNYQFSIIDDMLHFIRLSEAIKPDIRFTVYDIIHNCYLLNQKVNYNILSKNCQFQTRELINLYLTNEHKLPPLPKHWHLLQIVMNERHKNKLLPGFCNMRQLKTLYVKFVDILDGMTRTAETIHDEI